MGSNLAESTQERTVCGVSWTLPGPEPPESAQSSDRLGSVDRQTESGGIVFEIPAAGL